MKSNEKQNKNGELDGKNKTNNTDDRQWWQRLTANHGVVDSIPGTSTNLKVD